MSASSPRFKTLPEFINPVVALMVNDVTVHLRTTADGRAYFAPLVCVKHEPAEGPENACSLPFYGYQPDRPSRFERH